MAIEEPAKPAPPPANLDTDTLVAAPGRAPHHGHRCHRKSERVRLPGRLPCHTELRQESGTRDLPAASNPPSWPHARDPYPSPDYYARRTPPNRQAARGECNRD